MKNTHPNLYKTYLTYAVLSIALGLNFFFLTPAFMPFQLDKFRVGLPFLGCGIIKLMLLLFNSRNKWLRLSMALSVFIYTFWAGALTFDFFDRSLTSMQLPIFVLGLAALGYFLLIEPATNPATEKNGNGNGNGK